MIQLTEVQTQLFSTFRRRSKFPLHNSQRKILLISGDLFLLNLALLSGLILNPDISLFSLVIAPHPVWFALLTFLWLIIGLAFDNYEIAQAARVSSSTLGIVKTLLIVGVIYTPVVLLYSPLSEWPRFLLAGTLAASLIIFWRIVYAIALVRPNFQRRALIMGTGLAGRTIAKAIEEHDSGYEIAGYIASNAYERERDIKDVTLFDKWNNLPEFVRELSVSDIVLSSPGAMHSDQIRAVLACFEQGVRIVRMSDLFEEITGRIPVEHIGEDWLASLPVDWDSKGLYLIVKRAMDIVITCFGILFLLPIFPIIALAIKLDSSGPVFYRPERLGQGGKTFRLWKFRTMVVNADRIGDPTFTSKNDRRITRVGRILRLAHIDELPQFINIIQGQLSLVGPRPERYVPELEERIPFYRARYAVKPGATGWALVKQGYAEGLEGSLIKLQYDLYYIKHQSLIFDIVILCKSVVHMLTMGGQ